MVANPQDNKNLQDDQKVTVTLNNTWLDGTYALGYTENVSEILNRVELNKAICTQNEAVVFEKEGKNYIPNVNCTSPLESIENSFFECTVKDEFDSDNIIFNDGPYYLSSNPTPTNVTVRGLEEYEISCKDAGGTLIDSNSNLKGGIATLTVTDKETNKTASKTYLLLDDTQKNDSNNDNNDATQRVLNISFTSNEGNEETSINLNIPITTEYFDEEYIAADGTLQGEITNDILAEALTKQSEDPNATQGTEEVPNYTYQVSGFENSSQLEEPKVEIQLQEESKICLALNLVSNLETAMVSFDEMMEVSEVSMRSDEEIILEDSQIRSNETLIYASVEELDTDLTQKGLITRKEVETYLKNLPSYEKAQLNDDFKDITYKNEWLDLADPNINLDENGFLIIQAEVQPVSKPAGKPSTGSGGGGSAAQKPEEPKPTTPVVGTPTSMYRLYNRLTGEHLYTMDKDERDHLLTSDTWQDEGEGWISPSVSDYPVYRLLNPNTSDHHYTMDKNEFDTLPSLGWVAEGVAFFSADKDDENNIVLYRLYNPNAKGAGIHHYTTDEKERNTLVSMGWKYEGLAWAGLPAQK